MLATIKGKFAALKNKYSTDAKIKRATNLSVIAVFAVIGIVVAGFSLASSPDVHTPQSAASSTCGARVKGYDYQVPFGDAPWNVPVCDLPRHPRSDDYASRMYNYGISNDGSPAALNNRGKFNVSFGFEPAQSNWTRAVYYAKDATTTIQVQVCSNGCHPSNLDDGKNMYSTEAYLPQRKIPWNPAWKIAEAGDNELIIIDEDKGHLYSFSSVKTGLAAVTQCGPFFRERLCASSAKILRDHSKNIVDYRTFEGSDGSRGGGISYFATLVTPQEVAAGEIRHALGAAIFNSSFGPECTKEQLAKNDPKVIDVTCGTAVAPAGKFEHKGVKSIGERIAHLRGKPIDTSMTLSKTVPEGMRFALDIDDAYIENWLNSRPDLKANPRKAETARIFARALRDYGWMPLDTSGYGVSFQLAGGMSAKNRALWQELGISSEKDNNLLHGLFTEDNIYVVDPPTNQCVDGTKSKFYCAYTASKYEKTNSGKPAAPAQPKPTPAPQPSSPSSPPSDPTPEPAAPPTQPKPSPAPQPSSPANPVITPTSVTLPASIPVRIGWDWQMFEFHQGANLSWSASSSPHGIKKYVIKKNGQTIYEGSSRKYTDFRIDNGQKYKYELTAVDNRNNVSAVTTYEKTLQCAWFGWVCTFK